MEDERREFLLASTYAAHRAAAIAAASVTGIQQAKQAASKAFDAAIKAALDGVAAARVGASAAPGQAAVERMSRQALESSAAGEGDVRKRGSSRKAAVGGPAGQVGPGSEDTTEVLEGEEGGPGEGEVFSWSHMWQDSLRRSAPSIVFLLIFTAVSWWITGHPPWERPAGMDQGDKVMPARPYESLEEL